MGRANLGVRAALGEQEGRVPVAAEAVTVEPVVRGTTAVTAATAVMEAMPGRDDDLEAAGAVFPMIG